MCIYVTIVGEYPSYKEGVTSPTIETKNGYAGKKKGTETRTYENEVVLLHQAYLRHIVNNKMTAANMAHKKAHECKSQIILYI